MAQGRRVDGTFHELRDGLRLFLQPGSCRGTKHHVLWTLIPAASSGELGGFPTMGTPETDSCIQERGFSGLAVLGAQDLGLRLVRPRQQGARMAGDQHACVCHARARVSGPFPCSQDSVLGAPPGGFIQLSI